MKRILFVDDEPMLLEVIEAHFGQEPEQWDLDLTTSAEEALRWMSFKAYDVIVTDLRMPEMDGDDLLRQVQRLYPRTTRILLSGQNQTLPPSDATPVAHHYVSKPCEFDDLERAIRSALAQQETQADRVTAKL